MGIRLDIAVIAIEMAKMRVYDDHKPNSIKCDAPLALMCLHNKLHLMGKPFQSFQILNDLSRMGFTHAHISEYNLLTLINRSQYPLFSMLGPSTPTKKKILTQGPVNYFVFHLK